MEKDEYLKKLGKKIRELRRKEGDTQEEFAKKCSCDRVTLIRIEAGEVNTTISTLRDISVVLNIGVGELVDVDL
jgi:transcriptional regulator with XRE-family HTH domain